MAAALAAACLTLLLGSAHGQPKGGSPDSAAAPARAGTAADSAEYWLALAERDLILDDARARADHLVRAAASAEAAGDAAVFRRATLLRVDLLSALGASRSAATLLKAADVVADPPTLRVPYLIELSSSEAARGRFDQSDAALKEALQLALPLAGRDPSLALRVLDLQAAAASARNHDDEAQAIWLRMRAMARASRRPADAAHAEILLGRQALWTHDARGAHAFAAAAVASAYSGGDTSRICEALLLRGLVDMSEGHLGETRAHLWASRVLARNAGEDIVQAAAEEGLGDADARENLAATAFQWYSRAAATLDRAEQARWKRPFVPGSPWLGARAVLRRRLNLALWDKDPQRSWQIQEDDRTQALLRALSGSATNRLPRWTDAEIDEAHEAAGRRNALIAAGAVADSLWSPVMARLEDLDGRVRSRFLAGYRLDAARPEQLRRALPQATAMISFSLSPSTACAWVVTRDSMHLVPLGNGRDLQDAMTAVLGAGRRGPGAAPDSSVRLLEQRLGGAIARRIPEDVRRVIYVPDGQLMYLARFLPGAGPDSDRPLEVQWAASAGTWLHTHKRGASMTAARAWLVTPIRDARADAPGTPAAADWRALLGPGGELLDSTVTDAMEMFTAASGTGLWLHLPGVRITDRRPDQCEWLSPTESESDTSWLDLVELARGRTDVGVVLLPQRTDRLEREGSGLGSLGLAYATLLSGAHTVALQTSGGQDEMFGAWTAEFLARLRKGDAPVRAAAGATAAVRAAHPEAPAASIPTFALFGTGDRSVTFPGPRLVEPWVLGAIAISALLALGFGLRSGIRALRSRA